MQASSYSVSTACIVALKPESHVYAWYADILSATSGYAVCIVLLASSLNRQKVNGAASNKSLLNSKSQPKFVGFEAKLTRLSSPVNSRFSNCIKLVTLKSARPCTLIYGFASPFSKSTQFLSNVSSEPNFSMLRK